MSGRKYSPAKTRVKLTPGAAIRIAREMHGWSQEELQKRSKVPQSAISAVECGREPLGLDRAVSLAMALQVHPATLLWPNVDEVAATYGKKRGNG